MIKRLSVVFAMLLGFTGLALGAFEVRTLADLQKVGSGVDGWTPSAAYVLMNDIDATATATWNGGAGFAPIGNLDARFSGSFDGQGHVIWGLTVNRPEESYIGLFGRVAQNGAIRNLGLVGGRVRGGWGVGGLIGRCEGAELEHCFTFLSVEGSACAGGLIGYFYSGQVAQGYALGSVTGTDRVGGLVGWLDHGILNQCYSAGAVAGGEWGSAGGLVGEANGSPDGWGCYWDVETSGQEGSPLGAGLTRAQMKQSASYEGWDFESVWQVDEESSYPYFRGTGTPYLLALTVQGPGRVTAVPPLATYPTGTVVRLTAAATAGQSEFVGWEVDGAVSTASVVRVTVDGPRSVIARFRSARGIGTVTDLQKIGRDAAFGLDGRYWLTQDIDAKAAAAWNGGRGFLPIGTWDAPFTGLFDGRGKVIKNLTISRLILVDEDSLAIGLFGSVSGGTLQNIGLSGVRIRANGWDEVAGGLVGSIEGGTVRQCFVTGSLEGADSVGGLAGSSVGSLIERCYAAVGILAARSVGGLVGSVEGGTVRQSFTTGIVAGDDGVGGLIGVQHEAAVEQCYAGVSVVRVGDEGSVGGLIGNSTGGSVSVTGSYWDRESGGGATSAGGEARTAAQMKQPASFAGWDFGSVWGIAAGRSYPYLRWSPPPLQLTSVYLGEGTITTSPAGEALASGTVVTLAASPAAGYVFTGWYGVDGATNALKSTVVMNRPRAVAAVFRRAIRSITDLQKIGNDPGYPPDAYYVLTRNIDASATATWNGGAGFQPIGTRAAWFWGTLDGRGFAIRNLTINRPDEDNVGLFRYLLGSAIDLSLENCAITGGSEVGGLAGESYSLIRRCTVRGTVKGRDVVGGIVGSSVGELRGCLAVCDVSGTTDVGGLAGVNWGVVQGCHANGRVRGTKSVGALLGSSEAMFYIDGWKVRSSSAACSVSGSEQVGGLVGSCESTDISACFATGAVEGESDVGGLVGYFAWGSLSGAYACGRVEGVVSVGGLAGRTDTDTASNSFWDVASSGQAASAAGEGRTKEELKQAAFFSGGEFSNLWDRVETVSYPYLKAFPPPFGLYVATQGVGRVTVTPLRSAYAPGAVVQFSAERVAGQSEFVRWIGSGPNATAAVVSVTMDAPRSVIAVFRTAWALSRVEDLQKIGRDPAFELDGRYWLTQDIDAAATASWNGGKGFAPLGSEERPFTGTFDGRGFAVKGLTVKRPDEERGGLFAVVKDGLIENLSLTSVSVQGDVRVGGLAGVVSGDYACVRNCSVSGVVSGSDYTGGLVGYLGGLVERCYAVCVVSGSERAGGLVGCVQGGVVASCFANGTVTGQQQIGGLVGYLIPAPSITDGVCGPGEEDWTSVTGGRVEASYSSGTVEGLFLVGGLVGYNDKGDVSACYSTASVAGTDAVGGLVGMNASEGYEGRGQVFSCYAEGRVRLRASAGAFGHPYAGGLLGWNGGDVADSYAAGQVLAEPQDSDFWAVGGLVGGGESERVSVSYWDRQVSQLETSAGGEGRFTEEMGWQSTFASWDFESVWGIDEGADYPYLLAFNRFGFGQPRVEVCESERSVEITVVGGLTDKASAITVTLVPGTAGLSDYTVPAAAALKLSWAAGEVGPKTVTIPLKPDALAEGDEVFYAVLGSPAGGALARSRACAVTILDDDAAETLALALDNAVLTWTTGGAAKWRPLSDEEAANGSAAFSAALATGKISFVQATGVSGAGTLGFRWRTAAEAASAPALKLYDGKTLLWSSPVSEDAGDTGWIDEEVSVAGTAAHTFRWDDKQGADPVGVAGLDHVAWTPAGQSPATVYLGAEGAQGGWVSGGGQYWVGARVPVEAAALPGWRFVQWSDGGTLAKRTLTLEGDVELTAMFVRVPYVVGLPHAPAFGTVTGGGYCLPGKTVKLTAAPASGYTLLRWEDGSQAAARTISAEQAEEGMGADGLMRCTASFGLTALLAPPTVANPGSQTAMVGVPFALPLEIAPESEPVVQVTGLPAGLTYSAATRTLTGVPTVATPSDKAPSPVKVSVSNAGNLKTPATVSFTLTVEALPAWAVGAFNGTVTHPLWRADLDGTVDVVEPASLTITAQGQVTGKLTLRGTNYTFAAAAYADRILWTGYDAEGTPQQREKFLVEAQAVAGKNVLPLSLDVSWQGYPDDTGVLPQTLAVATQAERQTLQGEFLPAEDLNLCLYRNVWADKGMAAVVTNFAGYYTVTLPGSEGYGSGYLAFTVDKAGNVKTAGKLADGTAVSFSGPLTLDENGRVWALLLTAPAAYKGGTFCGKAEFMRAEDGGIRVRPLMDTFCLWESLNPAATGEYGVGFRRWLDLSGGWYNALINLRGYYENGLTVGGVAMPPPTFASWRVTDYDWDSGLEQPPKKTWTETNEVGCVEVSPNGVVLGVTPATGMGTGLAAPAADAPAKRADGTYDYTVDANRDGTLNASALTFSLIRATGLFKGSFNVYYDYVSAEDRTTDPAKQTWAHTVKKAAFEGALTPVRATGEAEGCGFFLWADTGMGSTGRTDAYGEPILAPYAFSRSYDVLLFRQ